jgi:NDP-sugar pyrophosphorylase family protein
MRAVILAAGEGRRLRPLTETVPKPLLPVAGRPLLAHLIELLRRHGVDEIAINLHHCPEAIPAYLGDGERFGVRIAYSLEERLLGSAGGVKRVEAFLANEPFFVLYGDVLTDLDLTALGQFHAERRSCLTMAVHQPEDPTRCGMARLGAGGRLLEFVEKPPAGRAPSPWANAGIYVVEPSVLRHIPCGRPFDFGSDLFPLLIARDVPLFGYVSEALIVDIGSPQRYRRAQRAARRRGVVEAA